jgi:hypothetical protein
MNGPQIKAAAIQKAKQVSSTGSNGNGNASKKRKKDLKPIITTDGQQDAEGSDMSGPSSNQAHTAGSVFLPLLLPRPPIVHHLSAYCATLDISEKKIMETSTSTFHTAVAYFSTS